MQSTLLTVRRFSTTARRLNGPVAPFRSGMDNHGKGAVTFDRNFPVHRQPKAWEKDRESKDSWFRRKHAHHHAREKKLAKQKQGPVPTKSQSLRKTISQLKMDPLVDYLYGTNPVLAALKAQRRDSFGSLFIHNPKESEKLVEILSLAKQLEIPVKSEYTKHDLNLMTNNGVHNGIVLETRPLEVEQLRMLGDASTETYSIVKEQFGARETVSATTIADRYPLALYIDEVSDPHNMGAILRSAYFLGVDFTIISERNCAPLSPVVSKTSSGALEFMPIFSSQKPLRLFEESREQAWTIISSVAPHEAARMPNKQLDAESLKEQLAKGPCMLVVGSEGEGVRKSLLQRSDWVVSLESGRADLDGSVDSLNASVATALLLAKFL